jgi:diaminohydroxyphosphoribosylaminopyrimidine deaminase/5-amino-6-(5-phosphoribosylamino)uracil reductase
MIGRRTLLLDRPKLDVRYWDGQNPRKYVADSSLTLEEQLDEMYRDKIQSLIVEGGTKLLTSFIERGLWDEANVETSNIFLKNGVKAPDFRGDIINIQRLENSVIIGYKNW